MWTKAVAAGAVVAAVAGAVVVWRQQVPLRPRRDMAMAVRKLLWSELQPVTLTNCQLQRFGEPNDGGYLVCANLLDDVAAGYSYGINGYDGWGCEVATTLGVPVHQYDCFDGRVPACAGKTMFHSECIGAQTATIENRPYDTLERQLARNGHDTARIVMKIDVEGAEWEVFTTSPDAVLDRIDQLVVEFHGTSEMRFVSAVQRLKHFFHVANLHMNNHACDGSGAPFPAWAYEVLFVNKRLDTVSPAPRATRYHALDRPNMIGGSDCQVLP